MSPIEHVIVLIAQAYQMAIIAAAIISWLHMDPNNPIVDFLNRITQPIFDRIRDYIPAASGFDFAPVVAFLLVGFVKVMLLKIL
jgi:YggT family protein